MYDTVVIPFFCVFVPTKGTIESFGNTITISSNTANIVGTGGSAGGGAATGTRKTKQRSRRRRKGSDRQGFSGRKGIQHRRHRRKNQSAMEPSSSHETRSVEEAKKSIDRPVGNASTGVNDAPTETRLVCPEIRTWFLNLSPKERMLALGFKDVHVVSVLSQLAVASWSMLPASEAGAVGESETQRTPDRPHLNGECAIFRKLTCTPTGS